MVDAGIAVQAGLLYGDDRFSPQKTGMAVDCVRSAIVVFRWQGQLIGIDDYQGRMDWLFWKRV